ncbi:hypothetical protein EDB84DRAFT_1508130 [Lactarius hengduanensis]|nr:hypothetical protein EDB84DRAFT_1508130 [Lactarius hengduanensis]
MAKLPDLPLETLLDIIDWSLQSWGHPYDRFLQLNSLSLVCRYFHDITAPIIFRKYRLQLREAPRKLGAPDPTCFLTGTSLLTWNQVGVRARLAHLRENAVFVRELRIVDWGQSLGKVCLGVEPGPAPFDPALLLDTLDALSDVTSVVFEATKQFHRSTHFPVELWYWLSRVNPANVTFDGSFTFPSALGPLPSVRSMSLRASGEAARVVEAVRPALLEISVEATDQKDHCFKDTFRPYPSLKQLDIRLRRYGDWIPCSYFDFTAYPEDARLAIHMKVPDTETYIEAPGAWMATEEHLKRVFVDNFEKLDVSRDDGSDTFVISRPPPGRTVGVRDLHLPQTDGDKEAVLGFEQAVLAAMPEHQLLNGPIDAAFWNNLDALFAKVYTQTFEALAA